MVVKTDISSTWKDETGDDLMYSYKFGLVHANGSVFVSVGFEWRLRPQPPLLVGDHACLSSTQMLWVLNEREKLENTACGLIMRWRARCRAHLKLVVAEYQRVKANDGVAPAPVYGLQF